MPLHADGGAAFFWVLFALGAYAFERFFKKGAPGVPPAPSTRPFKPVQPPPVNRPDLEAERMRKFLEALGLPAGHQPPQKPARRPGRHQPPRQAPPPLPPARPREVEEPIFGELRAELPELRVPELPVMETVSARIAARPGQLPEKGERDAYEITARANPAAMVRGLLASPQSLQSAFLLREVLGPPRSLQS